MAKLVVVRGPSAGLEYPLRGDMLLGRDPKAQVIIGEREVSAQHARLTQVGEKFYVEDLGSRNGTWLNGVRIQRQALNEGDEITIGRTSLRFDPSRFGPFAPPTDPGTMTLDLEAARQLFQLNNQSSPAENERNARVLKQLLDVTRSVGSLSGLKSTLEEIAGTLLQLFPKAGRVMVLLKQEGSSLEPVVTRWREAEEAPGAWYSETIVLKALQEQKAILSIDALSDDRFSTSQSVLDLRLRSLMCAPLVHRGQALGVIEVDAQKHGQLFTENDLNLLTAIVIQVAFAVSNARLFEALQGVTEAAVTTLSLALKARFPEAGVHAERVSRYALMLGRKLDLPSAELEVLKAAAALHDLHLLTLPDGVPPGTWQHLEVQARGHETPSLSSSGEAASTWELLAPLKALTPVRLLLESWREPFDGGGSSLSLKGQAIPLGARILAVAHAFDVHAALLPGAVGPAAAMSFLTEQSGKLLDPALVQLFSQLWSMRPRLAERRLG